MRTYFFICAICALLVPSCSSIAGESNWQYNGEVKFVVKDLPRFEEFTDGVQSPEMRAKDIDFESHKGAWDYRTRLRKALEEGPNFAGKYKIMTHGCGSACQVNWIIDTETGKVIDTISSTHGITYQSDSRLIIRHFPHEKELDYEYTVMGTYGGITFYELIIEPEGGLEDDGLYELLHLNPPLMKDNPQRPRSSHP